MDDREIEIKNLVSKLYELDYNDFIDYLLISNKYLNLYKNTYTPTQKLNISKSKTSKKGNSISELIGIIIKIRRKEKKVSKISLCEKTLISKETLDDIEKGYCVNFSDLDLIFDALEFPPSQFMQTFERYFSLPDANIMLTGNIIDDKVNRLHRFLYTSLKNKFSKIQPLNSEIFDEWMESIGLIKFYILSENWGNQYFDDTVFLDYYYQMLLLGQESSAIITEMELIELLKSKHYKCFYNYIIGCMMLWKHTFTYADDIA